MKEVKKSILTSKKHSDKVNVAIKDIRKSSKVETPTKKYHFLKLKSPYKKRNK